MVYLEDCETIEAASSSRASSRGADVQRASKVADGWAAPEYDPSTAQIVGTRESSSGEVDVNELYDANTGGPLSPPREQAAWASDDSAGDDLPAMARYCDK